jgi:hypothetical protein
MNVNGITGGSGFLSTGEDSAAVGLRDIKSGHELPTDYGIRNNPCGPIHMAPYGIPVIISRRPINSTTGLRLSTTTSNPLRST